MVDQPGPPDIKAHLDAADGIVDALPWRLGDTEAQRRRSRGRVAALAHQVAALIAGGWSADDVRSALAGAETAAVGPDAGAQERQWRSALKRAKHVRRQADRPPWPRSGLPSGDAAYERFDAAGVTPLSVLDVLHGGGVVRRHIGAVLQVAGQDRAGAWLAVALSSTTPRCGAGTGPTPRW